MVVERMQETILIQFVLHGMSQLQSCSRRAGGNMSSHFDYEIASPILSSDLIMISIREDILSKS